tara:strand:- start:37751 stop:37966 length:216 start_codon:yes stop_codon:yes gene_type:complete
MNFKIDFGNMPESREKLKELGVSWKSGIDIYDLAETKHISINKSKASFYDDYLSFMNDDNEQLTEEEFYSL